MGTSFYSEEELKNLGLKKYGNNVLISRFARIYGAENIVIGNNVRIDDFCILSGKILFGNNIHIGAGTYIFGAEAGVEFQDFSGISSRCAFYAVCDDFSGEYMTNPTVPDEYTGAEQKKVIIGKHVVFGTGVSVLSGVTIKEGCAIGAHSLVKKDTEPWGIYAGSPCRRIKERKKDLLDLAEKYENNERK